MRALPLTPALVLTAFLLGSCAGRTPVEAPFYAAEPFPTVDPLPEVEPRPYRMQAGDLIAIKFWGVTELDEEQYIRPDGAISLPYVDEVPAAGLTPQEPDDRLTELYSLELARPNITVIVREAVIPLVYVSGEVGIKGTVPLTDGLTLFRAVQASGGFLTTARRKEVVLVRQLADGSPAARAVDLRPVLTGADPTADVALKARDIVFVPRTKVTNLNLFINQYIDDVVPLQSVFSGALLGSITQTDTTSDAVAPPQTNDGGEP